MPENSPGYLTLKINKTSVMLYANDYIKLSGQRASSTVHTYLGSFPVTSTEVPEHFEALLRDGTRGRPERYQELMQRITDRVLIPAMVRRDAEAARATRKAIENALNWATQNLTAIPELPQYAIYIRRPELQSLLKGLLDKAARMEAYVASPEQALPNPDGPAETESSETKLQRLLEMVETACVEIAALMPEAAGGFKRGYEFQPNTVELVRRVWFRTSDAIAALGARRQLKRPGGWGELRSEVMGDGKAGADVDAEMPLW
jgi:hypothetical protein